MKKWVFHIQNIINLANWPEYVLLCLAELLLLRSFYGHTVCTCALTHTHLVYIFSLSARKSCSRCSSSHDIMFHTHFSWSCTSYFKSQTAHTTYGSDGTNNFCTILVLLSMAYGIRLVYSTHHNDVTRFVRKMDLTHKISSSYMHLPCTHKPLSLSHFFHCTARSTNWARNRYQPVVVWRLFTWFLWKLFVHVNTSVQFVYSFLSFNCPTATG